MVFPVETKIIGDCTIAIKYSDGLHGELEVSKILKKENSKISKICSVLIDQKTKDIILNEEITLCKNALHNILVLKKQMNALGLDVESD